MSNSQCQYTIIMSTLEWDPPFILLWLLSYCSIGVLFFVKIRQHRWYRVDYQRGNMQYVVLKGIYVYPFAITRIFHYNNNHIFFIVCKFSTCNKGIRLLDWNLWSMRIPTCINWLEINLSLQINPWSCFYLFLTCGRILDTWYTYDW